jgi:type IV pilus assembly protein PilE
LGAFSGPLFRFGRGGGFTLIELLISLVVIAILATIAYPIYTGYVAKSKQQDAQVQLTAIRQAEEMYKLQYHTYTGDLNNSSLSWRNPMTPPHKYSYSIDIGWTSTTYTARASGNIDGDPYIDIWIIDQNGSLMNIQNDLNN